MREKGKIYANCSVLETSAFGGDLPLPGVSSYPW